MIGGIGLPTWERKNELWREGARLAYIVILYEALPCFLFSFSFLLSSFGNVITVFIGGIMKVLAVLAFIFCSFFLPFAFCTSVQDTDVRRAFEFEKIAGAVKEVLVGLCRGVRPRRLLHVRRVQASCHSLSFRLCPFIRPYLLRPPRLYLLFYPALQENELVRGEAAVGTRDDEAVIPGARFCESCNSCHFRTSVLPGRSNYTVAEFANFL